MTFISHRVRLSAAAVATAVLTIGQAPASADTGGGAKNHTPVPATSGKQLAQIVCPPFRRQVCGWRNGRWNTYWNRCRARRAGATNIRSGACQTAGGCPRIYRPVCGWSNGAWRNYNNLCLAQRVGARNIRNGVCRTTGRCPTVYRPVCGTWRGRRVNFRNICHARRARAFNIRSGRCRGRPGPRPTRGACALGAAKVYVYTPHCGEKFVAIPFTFRLLSNRGISRQQANSGVIGRNRPRYGVCNFHTDIVYRCVNGRLRIQQILKCKQGLGPNINARCRVVN